MQDKYVGDIGDFGKYALLKFLAKRDVPLGIVWYLTNAPGNDGDGGFIKYLSSPNAAAGLGKCDAQLLSALRAIVDSHRRRVRRVRELRIFAGGTLFYEERLDFASVPRPLRPEKRTEWCQKALGKVRNASLVFLDPDNGLSLKEEKKYQKSGPKYVFLDELREYVKWGKSLILYCHQDRRKGGLREQVREGIELLSKVSPLRKAWAFTFHRQSVRIFFVLPSTRRMAKLLAQRSKDFAAGCFGSGGHFCLKGLP